MRTARELEGVTSLGSRKTIYKQEYDSSLLERFVNKHPEAPYMVQLNCPEFTSLCPKTGQPDFAKILISYIPDKYLVESKSLKLYLFSFRNTGDFHEDIVNTIKNDLVRLLSPRYLEVIGLFNARGGIGIYPTAFYCKDDAFQELAHQRMLEACKEK